MIGRCSSCESLGEVDFLPVPNGGQRLLCPMCSNGWGPPHLPARERFRLLVGRLRDGSLAPSEERDLRFALDGILERSQGGPEAEAAQVLLDELLSKSMMNPFRPRPPW